MRSPLGLMVMLSALLVSSSLKAEGEMMCTPPPASLADATPIPADGIGSQTALSLASAVAQELSLPPPPAPITLVLKADLRSQRLTVEENGKTKFTWPISSGRAGFATRTGTFRPQWTSKLHLSRQYDLAPMPHAVFFNAGAAFHGTSAVSQLGQPASHGCIRLAPANAARLYALVHKHGFYQTKVIVHGGSRETTVARRDAGKSSATSGRRDATSGERRKRSRYGQYGAGLPRSL
jgi:hypothetical protein